MKIRVMATGRGYHNALDLPGEVDLDDGATVDDALALLASQRPDNEPLPPSCLIAVSGEHIGVISDHEPRALREGDELVLIAPVAGG